MNAALVPQVQSSGKGLPRAVGATGFVGRESRVTAVPRLHHGGRAGCDYARPVLLGDVTESGLFHFLGCLLTPARALGLHLVAEASEIGRVEGAELKGPWTAPRGRDGRWSTRPCWGSLGSRERRPERDCIGVNGHEHKTLWVHIYICRGTYLICLVLWHHLDGSKTPHTPRMGHQEQAHRMKPSHSTPTESSNPQEDNPAFACRQTESRAAEPLFLLDKRHESGDTNQSNHACEPRLLSVPGLLRAGRYATGRATAHGAHFAGGGA